MVASTIFALSSGQPPAAIAIVRISGAGAFQAARALAGSLPSPRHAALRTLRDPRDGRLLDQALVLLFEAPATATGDDLVELHLHGGRAVVRAVTEAIGRLPGLRPALPGEFTRRALANGRIDLAQAEGLGDLLAAETEAQRRAAMASVEGKLSRAIHGWAERVLTLAAHVEAALDFSDEDDVVDDPLLAPALGALAAEIREVLAAPPVERLRDGVRVVLAGPPNAGKSTLLNALAERDAAIVSPIAGTTRDRIEAPVVRGGIAYLLIDTAGLAEVTDDPVEAIGIARAGEAIAAADLVLWLDDTPPPYPDRSLWLFPRADLRPPSTDEARLPVSVRDPESISALWQAIAARAAGLVPQEDAMLLNERQRGLCAVALTATESAIDERDLLVVAEHLRVARAALHRITGRADVEAMLDALFARFCIGK